MRAPTSSPTTTTRLYTLTPPQNQFAIVLDGRVISAPQTQRADHRWHRLHHRQLHPEELAGAGEPAEVRRAPALVHQADRGGDQPAARQGAAAARPDRRPDRPAARGALLAAAVPRARLRDGRVAAGRGCDHLRGRRRCSATRPGLRLTLAGITGLIVSIGVTADSFIVYFERVRDEVRDGRSLRSAVDTGWKRARRTILAADSINFLAAVVLYILAAGGVRGFAYTLGLATIIDVVVVILFTHPLLTILARTKFFGQGHRWSGLDPKRLGAGTADRRQGQPRHHRLASRRRRHDLPGRLMFSFAAFGNQLYTGERSIEVVRRQKIWYAISAVVLLLSLVALLTRGLVLGPGVHRRHGVPRRLGADHEHDPRCGRGDRGRPGRRGERDHRRQHLDPGADRRADRRPDRQGHHGAGQGLRRRRRTTSRSPSVGPSWGQTVSKKAIQGLIVFLILVALFISVYFRTWKMALSAIIALRARPVHHGRHLRPGRVRGHPGVRHRLPDDPRVLAVRHRRRVRQGAGEHRPHHDADEADLLRGREPRLNQTLVRSINTSVVALLPVGSILFIGAFGSVPAR